MRREGFRFARWGYCRGSEAAVIILSFAVVAQLVEQLIRNQ